MSVRSPRIVQSVLVLVPLILVLGCGGGSGGGGGGGAVTPPTSTPASRNLQELPEVEAQLPASLAAGGTTSGSSLSASAEGDITIVAPSGIPDVKAQGWYDLKDAAGLDTMTEAFVDELREIASEQGLEFGVVYDLGQRSFFDGQYDLGNLKLAGSDNDMTVYWYASPLPGFRFWAQFKIVRSGDDWNVTARFTQISSASSPLGEMYNLNYSTFDTASGESLFLVDSEGTDPDYGAYAFEEITQTVPNGDGSLTILSGYDEGGGFSDFSVGWGNDTEGGVIGVGSWDGYSYATKEFYNGNGSLIEQSWGTSTPDDAGLLWTQDGAYNLSDLGAQSPPNTVYRFYRVDGNGIATKYASLDDALDTQADTDIGDSWGFYYKAGASWATGDALYNWISGQEYDDGNQDTYVWRERFDIGYQVPSEEAVFGGSFYFEDRYPLKHLLPLTGSYSGREVLRLEGPTFTETWDGESWTWTDYLYAIDVNGNLQPDQPSGGTGDFPLDSVWMSENYVWDAANQRELKVMAPFLTTTDGRLPSFFSFSTANQSLVSGVESKILNIYNNDLASLSFDDYRSRLTDLSSRPEFDELE